MPLGTEIDLGPGHIVLDGVPAPAKEAQQPPPSFRPVSIVARSPISAAAELLLDAVTAQHCLLLTYYILHDVHFVCLLPVLCGCIKSFCIIKRN